MIRKAAHQGGWYSADPQELKLQFDGCFRQTEANDRQFGCIAPHAGYSYCGKTAAHSYASLMTQTEHDALVFILGPSHHKYLRNSCALSECSLLETPLGNLKVDEQIMMKLRESGQFESLSMINDEDEHSLEMQFPLLKYVIGERFNVTVVPIVVGCLDYQAICKYASILQPFFDGTNNKLVVSSDFCHWGGRFNYTHLPQKDGEIWQKIEALDRQAMQVIEEGTCADFMEYLKATQNTICGRFPICIMLKLKESLGFVVKFQDYRQSSQCQTKADSSVSYAAATIISK